MTLAGGGLNASPVSDLRAAPPHIERLSAVAGRYGALLCDAWGVIHNGVSLFDGAEEALLRFRAERGPVIVLTNAPRPSSIIPAQLDRLGLSRAAWDAVVTSGDATRAEIARRLPARPFRIGPAKDDGLYDGLDVSFAPIEEASFIVCSGLRDELAEEPEDYRALLAPAAARGLPMICANPDVVVRLGGRLIWCAGALAQVYEDLGGEVIYGGKPHAPIYRLAVEAAQKAAGRTIGAGEILAVGDGLHTDIAGAARQGFDAIYVSGAGGIHDGETGPAEALASAGLPAAAIMESLAW